MTFRSLLKSAAFLAALVLSPSADAQDLGPAPAAPRPAALTVTVPPGGSVTATPPPPAGGIKAPPAPGAPAAVGTNGPKVDPKIPTGPVEKRSKGRGRVRRVIGVLNGKPIVFDTEKPCVKTYLAEIEAKGWSTEPDMYVATLPEKIQQYIAYDSATGNLSGTAVSVCRKGTEPVQHSPGIDAYKGTERGDPVCAMVRQWLLYINRSASRRAEESPPTVEIHQPDGSVKNLLRWGVVVGFVTQPNVGYSYCAEPLKSSANKEDVDERIAKALKSVWDGHKAIWDKIGEIDKKDADQDAYLVDHEERIKALEARKNWFNVGLMLALNGTRPTNVPFGLQFGWMGERLGNRLFFALQLKAFAVNEQYMLPKNKLPSWGLGGGGSIILARKWANGLVVGADIAGLVAQSVSFENGKTATHGTLFWFVGAGPAIGYAGKRFYALLSVPIGVGGNMTETVKDGRKLFPTVPDFQLNPTVATGVRF